MSDFTTPGRDHAESVSRMSSERRLLRALMRAAMYGPGYPATRLPIRSQNDAVKEFLGLVYNEIRDPGQDVDPIRLLVEFAGTTHETLAKELYRVLFREDAPERKAAPPKPGPTLKRPEAPEEPEAAAAAEEADWAEDGPEPEAEAAAPEAEAETPEPQPEPYVPSAVAEILRQARRLWEADIDGQPLRFATFDQIRAVAKQHGEKWQIYSRLCHGKPGHLLAGDVLRDEDFVEALQWVREHPLSEE